VRSALTRWSRVPSSSKKALTAVSSRTSSARLSTVPAIVARARSEEDSPWKDAVGRWRCEEGLVVGRGSPLATRLVATTLRSLLWHRTAPPSERRFAHPPLHRHASRIRGDAARPQPLPRVGPSGRRGQGRQDTRYSPAGVRPVRDWCLSENQPRPKHYFCSFQCAEAFARHPRGYVEP
jgi:hypothetical protein